MLEQIDVTEAREALLTVRRRVEQYAWLMYALHTRDISEDRHFRRAWLNHFKLRDKDREFCRFCFRWLEEHKEGRVSFEKALLDLYRRFGVLDPASASKLAAICSSKGLSFLPMKPCISITIGTFSPAFSSGVWITAASFPFDPSRVTFSLLA